jgi:hypothetical protein
MLLSRSLGRLSVRIANGLRDIMMLIFFKGANGGTGGPGNKTGGAGGKGGSIDIRMTTKNAYEFGLLEGES